MTLTRNSRLLASCITFAVIAAGISTSVQAQDRFTVSADGKEVLDTQTKLTWRRCVEGLNWDGKTCSGKASKFNFGSAKKHAEAQGPGWRVPSKDELLSLVDKTAKKKPLINASAFPATPTALYWASRPESTDNLNAWIVNFSNARVYGNTGSKAVNVRLVRTAG